MIEYHIGVDSTDSATEGMCTTYLGAVLLERMKEVPVELSTYPELVRLNPNVPWKTRGNGSIVLRYQGEEGLKESIIDICREAIEELSVFKDPQTNPGLAVLQGEVPDEMNSFYGDCLHRIVTLEEAEEVSRRSGADHRTWKNGRGLIGAIAGIGAILDEFTYEAILYRPGHIKERERNIDLISLRRSSEHHASTFFNIDANGDPLCIPHSPCPVILGIRGKDPSDTRDAMLEIEAQPRERWVLWRTDQHTDAHIMDADDLEKVTPFTSVSVDVRVSSSPSYAEGGHLFFDVEDRNGLKMTAWAYEPTKGFRKRISALREGDLIRVWASVREERNEHGRGLNLEKVLIKGLASIKKEYNPRCPQCGGPTESMGKGQGLRCRKCGKRDGIYRKTRSAERKIDKGPIQPPPAAWRHLFRPFELEPETEIRYEGPYFGTF